MKTALITGCNNIISCGIAEALVEKGWSMAIAGNSQSSLEKINSLSSTNGNIIGFPTDIYDHQNQRELVSRIINKWGRLDALIVNSDLDQQINFQEVYNSSLQALKISKGHIITLACLSGANLVVDQHNSEGFGFENTGFNQRQINELRAQGIKVRNLMGTLSIAESANNNANTSWKINPTEFGNLVVTMLDINSTH